MNNSQLFKAAHKKARLTVGNVGDYQIAFTLALRELIAENKKPVVKKETFVLNKDFESEVLFIVLVFATLIIAVIVGVIVSPFHMVACFIVGIMGSFVVTGLCWLAYSFHVFLMKKTHKIILDTSYEVWLQVK